MLPTVLTALGVALGAYQLVALHTRLWTITETVQRFVAWTEPLGAVLVVGGIVIAGIWAIDHFLGID